MQTCVICCLQNRSNYGRAWCFVCTQMLSGTS